MSHPEIRLKYVATLNSEALGEDTDPDYELQYIDIGNVDSSGHVHEVASYRFADAPSRARRRVRHGDVIVSCVRTYLQAIAPIESPPDNLIVSTGFAVVRPLEGRLRAGFCKYALREPRFLAEVERRSVGVSYPAINSSDLAAIPIPVPPHDVQHRVERFLDRETARLDALVAAKQRVLALLAEKRKAIIAAAVRRGLDPKVKLRDSGVPWLGKMPAHWKIERVRWLFRERDIRGEPALPLMEVSIANGVTVREFSDSRIETTAADFNSYKVARRGDIAFNKMRMWQGAVGVAPCDGLVSPDYVVAQPDAEMLSIYAGYLFRIEAFSAECGRRSHGLTWDRLRIYWEEFREIPVPLPPVSEQEAIVAHIAREAARLDAVHAATDRTIALLKERRSALIATAVTGQLDVGAVA